VQTDEKPEVLVFGGIWPLESTAGTPEIEVESWEVYEVQLPGRTERTRHIVGLRGWHREGVVSSAITAVDAATNRFTTESGRIYMVRGGTGGNLDSEYVWRRWMRVNSATGAKNVTLWVKELLTVVVTGWQFREHPHPQDPRRKTQYVSGTVRGTCTPYSGDVERLDRTLMEGIDRSGRFFKLEGHANDNT
jgi:hypothetical protein